MCSHEGCIFRGFYNINSVQYCKFHAPMELGMCVAIKKNGDECGCPAKRSFKGINTCLVHLPKSSAIETCSICLEDCEIGTKPTACGHFFHFKCMKEWKTRANGHTCPMCRYQISKPARNEAIIQRVIAIARETNTADEFMEALMAQIDPVHINVVLNMLDAR